MKNLLFSAATVVALAGPMAVQAGEQVTTIEVTGLYCASCPYIAAQAIMDVPSANITDGFYDPRAQLAQFVVQYDDTETTLEQLISATSEYGYPARQIDEIAPADNS